MIKHTIMSNLYELIPQECISLSLYSFSVGTMVLAAVTPCLFKCILSVLIQSVIMVVLTRSECNQTRFEEACARGNNRLGELIATIPCE